MTQKLISSPIIPLPDQPDLLFSLVKNISNKKGFSEAGIAYNQGRKITDHFAPFRLKDRQFLIYSACKQTKLAAHQFGEGSSFKALTWRLSVE
jgi:hypothetical protein